MNYFELYPGDYLRDTSRLTMLEHGAYLRLLLAYYGEEDLLPAAHAELFVVANAVTAAEKAAVIKVADRYFPVDSDGFRHNGRADEEIAKGRKRINAAHVNGSLGGRPKKPKKNPVGSARVSKTGGFQNPAETHSGEALHTPHATRKASTPDTSPASEQISERAGDLARALQAMGYSACSPGSPEVQRAAEQWITVDELRAAHAGKEGKPIAYLVSRAIGKRGDAAELGAGQGGASPPPTPADPAEAARAQQIAKLEDQVYDTRHLCDTLGMIDADERDRRIADLRRQQADLRQGAAAEAAS